MPLDFALTFTVKSRPTVALVVNVYHTVF
jgi:hypothetical protein